MKQDILIQHPHAQSCATGGCRWLRPPDRRPTAADCIQVFYKLAPYLWQSARDKAEKMKQKDIDKNTDPNSLKVGSSLDHKHANHITRVSLRLLMPTWKSVFSKLFTPCEVVEPTYKDIISVYRCTHTVLCSLACIARVLAVPEASATHQTLRS